MSVFDDAFRQPVATHHTVFGELAVYTQASTAEETELKFLVDKLEQIDEQRSGSRSDVWVLTGSLLQSDIDTPRKGDSIVLDSDADAKIFTLTQSPTCSEDSLQWNCEFRHEQATSRGGNNTFPVI